MGWCTRERTCSILPLFEMAESHYLSSSFYVLHYLLFKKFTSAFYHICMRDWTIATQLVRALHRNHRFDSCQRAYSIVIPARGPIAAFFTTAPG